MTDQRGGVREPAAPAPRTPDGASRTGPGQPAPALSRSPDPLRDLAERLRRGAGADVLVLLRPGDTRWDVLETAPTAPSGASLAVGPLAPQLSAVLPGPREAPDAAVVRAGDTPLGRLLAPAGLEALVQVPLRVADELWGLLCLGRAQPTGPSELARAQAEAAAATELLVLAERLRASERRADTDPLTGLANRRAFDERAQAAFDEHLRTGTSVGVVICDLNGLKTVNDRAGHDAGDQLLVAVGQVLARAAASVPGVVPARLGGDEFGLLLVGVPDEQVLALAVECCRQVEQLPDGAGLSCGVATTAGVLEPVVDVHHLLRLADAAQYRAKRLAARSPVVAGRPPDPDALRRAADVAEPVPTEPRQAPLVRVLAAGVDRLAAADPAPTLERLLQVVAVVEEHLDPAAWEVAHVPPDSTGAGAGASTVASGGSVPAGAAPVTAGAVGGDGSWLLAVHLAEPSRPAGLDAVLRALVALAVRPG